MKIAFCEARGLLNDLNDKLGGENGDRWRDKLANMLREATFQTWRKLQIGLLRLVRSYSELLTEDSFRVSEFASQIVKKMKLVKGPTTLELVGVSVAELGFVEGATFAQIIELARQLGLELCPAEVGPALRLAYKDQPKGEWLRIAMEPVAGSDGRLFVFFVGCDDDGLWLRTLWFYPRNVSGPGPRWVFVRKS